MAQTIAEKRYFKGHGAQVVKFAQERIVQTKGRWAGQPLTLEPWQRELLDELFLVDENGKRVYREALIGMARKNGKALALDTPIPTPEGWTTMGALAVGDRVFGPDGTDVEVEAVTEAMEDRPCYRVVFSDGASIVADAEHEWVVDDRRYERRQRHGLTTRTTREMATQVDLPNGKRWRVPVAGPLDLPEVDLPLDPYTLGAWLGDGTTTSGSITNVDPEVWDSCAFEPGSGWNDGKTRTLYGLRPILRRMGLLGRKAIPVEYQRAATRQRMALLRGLMDTDGTISARGLCEFDTTSPRLLADVLELIQGLGWKANVVSSRAILRGKDCGPKWTIQFTAFADRPVFTIPRKLARQKPPPARRTRSQVRQIVAIESVDSVPVRCIQVDGGVYLAGDHLIPTHNSSLSAAIALHGLIATGEGGPEVYAAAGSEDQARVVFQQAREYVEASPWLRQWLRPLRTQIRCLSNNGVFRVLSATGSIAHGLNPSLVVIDELHVHRDPELYYALTTGVVAREEPLVVSITTAGYDRATICWDVYQRGLELQAQGVEAMREAGFLFYWCAAPPDAPPDDRSGWAAANPSSWITDEVLEREYERLPESVFRRLHLNQWCVTPDTLVQLADGSQVRADALAPGERLIAFDEATGRLVGAPVKRVADNGVRPVFEVVTRRGRRIRVTAEHRFWVHPGRWVRAADLSAEHRVKVARGWEPEEPIPTGWGWFLGAMVGDGGIANGSVGFTSEDAGVVARMRDEARALGVELRPRGDHPAQYRLTCGRPGGRNGAIELLREAGLWGQTSREKRVPELIYRGGRRAWAGFLAGYLDADGCVAGGQVIYVSCHDDLLRDVQHLLAMLGVQSSFTPNRATQRGRLVVTEQAGIDKLAELLCPAGKKGSRLRALCGRARRDGPRAADRFDFDRVRSVTLLAPTSTVGIEVEGVHTHVTAGLVTHNTEAEDSWIRPVDWDAGAGDPEVDLSEPIWVGVDIGLKRDATALVWCQWHDDKLHIGHDIRIPEPGRELSALENRVRLQQLASRMEALREVAFDPWSFRESAELLAEEGLPMVEFNQTAARMAPASEHLYELVKDGRIVHDGDPVFRRQVLAAVASETERGWRISKRKSKERIDAAIALAMAVDRAVSWKLATQPDLADYRIEML